MACKTPEVAIVTTFLNERQYIAEAIESVLAQQDAPLWEMVLVDDGSTDGSGDIALGYAQRQPHRIRVVTHERLRNRGTSRSRNLGVSYTNAPLLTFLDADDVWLPHRLGHHARLLAVQPHVDMLYGQTERWFLHDEPYREERERGWPEAGEPLPNFTPPLLPEGERPGPLRCGEPLVWFLQDESLVPCTCSVTVRRKAFDDLRGFEPIFTGLYDDQVLYAKLALAGRIVMDRRCVARYRQRPGSCCSGASAATAARAREQFLAWLSDYMQTNFEHPPVELRVGAFA